MYGETRKKYELIILQYNVPFLCIILILPIATMLSLSDDSHAFDVKYI